MVLASSALVRTLRGTLRRLPSTLGRATGARRAWHDTVTDGRLGLPEADAAKLPSRLAAHAMRLLRERPAACSVGTAAVTGAAGDALAQLREYMEMENAKLLAHYGYRLVFRITYDGPAFQLERIDPEAEAEMAAGGEFELRDPHVGHAGPSRTLAYAGVAASLVGVGGELWHRFLRRTWPGNRYQAAIRAILDGLVYAPTAVLLFSAGVQWLRTSDPRYTLHRLQYDGLHPLYPCLKLWWGGLAASYLMLPAHRQPAAAVGLAVVWHALFSHTLHAPSPMDPEREAHVASHLRALQLGGGE